MTLSIIIPVLNEEENLKVLLPYLKNNSFDINEIIVVDGGSIDASVKVAENESAILIRSEKGRARQMNAGAKGTSGDILYFLHADTFPPKGFDQFIIEEVKKGNPAGCFQMRFDHNHWWLRLASWLTKFRWRACRGGDQSLFITKSLFNEIGGYDENYIIYEDNILIDELYKRNTFIVLQKAVTTSARRYEEKGVWRLQYHFLRIHLMKRLGHSPDRLYKYYKEFIAK
jgi:rSAM/selenodomain-associated transferase 2